MAKSKPKPIVVDTTKSARARLHPVPLNAITMADTFWAPRRRINRETTIPSQYRHCEETGRIDNFRRASKKKDIPFEGIYFNDSDVYKWLEAAAWTLATDADPALTEMVDTVITEIEDAQQPDGYINTYFMFDKAGERWSNMRDMHELYLAGHLIQASVAHYRATGSDRLLAIATRFADYICSVFGPAKDGKLASTDGHEEIELALVELARATGNQAYLHQAQFFIDIRGHGALGAGSRSAYYQDHQPFRELDAMVGHAVRAVYHTTGATDLYLETGEGALLTALERLWQHMTTRVMYVSGGLGSRYEGEAFGADYELPNSRAYTETCAAIGSVMWNWRMLALDGDAHYADLMEHTLYNAVLPGLSLDGQAYFYQNPLADEGQHRRQPWFGCACCPPNVARLLASLPSYIYSTSEEGVWVHLYAAGEAEIALTTRRKVRLTQATNYPWDDTIDITVDGQGSFSLFLRIPAWCDGGATLSINGQLHDADLVSGSYTAVTREWKAGDVVQLRLPMPVERIVSHPYATDNNGRVALMRGPVLYCVEQADNPGVDLHQLQLPVDTLLTAEYQPSLLGGVVTLHGKAVIEPLDAAWEGKLYRAAPVHTEAQPHEVELTAIPYYAWANREPGAMRVWLRV